MYFKCFYEKIAVEMLVESGPCLIPREKSNNGGNYAGTSKTFF